MITIRFPISEYSIPVACFASEEIHIQIRFKIRQLRASAHDYRAAKPPSNCKQCPVMNDAAPEQSQTTAPATSSRVPNRPIG